MQEKFLKIFYIFFIVYSLTLDLAFGQPADVNKIDQAQFLCLADIHFDPFTACGNKVPCPLIQKLRQASAGEWKKLFIAYETKLQEYRQDTNYQLLNSTLNAAKKIANEKHAQFVLVLGDFLGHNFRSSYKKYANDKSLAGYQAFVYKTMQFLTHELRFAFPSMDIYPLMGNNDSNVSDYYSKPHGQFFQETAYLWSQLIQANKTKLLQIFPIGGYYAVDVPNQPNLRLIMLNTILFSNQARGKDIARAANEQLQWLHTQLQSLKSNHQKAIIAMHIPPGIDVYATLRMRLFRLIELWKGEYIQRFETELNENAANIMAVFAGHLHADWFQILTFGDSDYEIPFTGVPSLSPIFGNNPSFQLYTYAPQTLKLTDYITYYYSLRNKSGWDVEYNFNHIYLSENQHHSRIDKLKVTKQKKHQKNNAFAEF